MAAGQRLINCYVKNCQTGCSRLAAPCDSAWQSKTEGGFRRRVQNSVSQDSKALRLEAGIEWREWKEWKGLKKKGLKEKES